MDIEEIIQNGKNKLRAVGIVESHFYEEKNLYPRIPGLGWVGRGLSYSRNYEVLARYSIQTKIIGDNFFPDTSISLFQNGLSTPILAAPMSGIKSNLQEQIDEKTFLDSVLGGCIDVGSLGSCGDSYDTTGEYCGTAAIEKNRGIAVIKPRSIEEISARIHTLQEKNVVAIGIDMDGLTELLLKSSKVSRKNKKDLQEIRSLFQGPMFLKGLLSVEDVSIAHELGFDAVVLSNHGGRSIDYCPAPAHALPTIAKYFKGKIKILADGGIRSGYDAFIYLALGADAVLVGRMVLYGAISRGRYGVSTIISKLTSDLSRAMLLTDCKSIQEIGRQSIKLYG